MKNIKGFEDLYSIDEFGNVISHSRWHNAGRCGYLTKERQLKKVDFSGYHIVFLTKNRKAKYFFIHRLVAQAFIPNPENKPFVNHIDGDKLNNHVSNLEWCTAKENCVHAHETGLVNCSGESHVLSKLTESQVQEIRKRYKNEKISHRKLAEEYSVSHMLIGKIIRKINWKHI